jgi:hypothetical protein
VGNGYSPGVLVRIPVHGKFAKKLQQGTKISAALKKYTLQICYPHKVLIWADLETDQKSKDINNPEKKSTHIFCSGIIFTNF